MTTRTTVVTVLASAVALCGVFSARAAAVPPGPNGPIAFSGVAGNSGQVFVVNPDGSFRSQVTDDPVGAGGIVWFRDGRRLAYFSSLGIGGRRPSLKVLDIQTGGTRNAVSSDLIAPEMFPTTSGQTPPRWSPDGTRLVYGANSGASSQVLVADRSGARVNVAVSAGGGRHPDWSPDGTRIVFATNRGLHTVNPDGSGLAQLLAPPAGSTVSYTAPSWSPDGGRIAFLSFDVFVGTPSQIHVMNADGSSPTPVGPAFQVDGPTWSPDGSRIGFTRGFGMDKRLWTMRPDGSDARPLVGAQGRDRGNQWLAWSSGPLLTRRLLRRPNARAVNASVVSGKVLVRRRGSRRFTPLSGTARLGYGSELNARRGRVRVVADAGGGTATSDFSAGRFRLVRRARAVTELVLTGPMAGCGSVRSGRAGAAARRGRRLLGDGKGRFRTRGRRSAATVTGTRWLVEDRCDGSTLTRVRSGVAKVHDFVRRRTVTLRAGRRYVAGP